ncbi:MAG: hypothetical protein JWL59_1030 [Chthoniobacteraceae bacterium]|nr:hypothetical protein [Chthoniobacteraceae bacterium]
MERAARGQTRLFCIRTTLRPDARFVNRGAAARVEIAVAKKPKKNLETQDQAAKLPTRFQRAGDGTVRSDE